MKVFFLIFSFFISITSFGALPPMAESLRYLDAIVHSPEVYTAFGELEWVKSIQDHYNGNYLVLSGNCSLAVKVEPILSNPPKMVPELSVKTGVMNCVP